MQLDQPMEMVRHDHPGQRSRLTLVLSLPELTDKQAADAPVLKDQLPLMGNRSDQVNTARLRTAPDAQPMCTLLGGHSFVLFCEWKRNGRRSDVNRPLNSGSEYVPPPVGASLLAKSVNDNAVLSRGPCRLFVFREQARSYIRLVDPGMRRHGAFRHSLQPPAV